MFACTYDAWLSKTLRGMIVMMRSGSGAMPPVVYLFIDGAYLDELASELGEPYFGEPLQLDYPRLCVGCKKTFYYDCLPAKKSNESEGEFADRRDEKRDFFNYLRSLDSWHVNEGVGRWNKKRGSSQKEIDILIAVDMLTHAYRRNMDQIRFIAGDLDFRPLLEAAVGDGMHVTLWYGAQKTNVDLIYAADSKVPIDIYRLFDFCLPQFRERCKLPSRSTTLMEIGAANITEIASIDGTAVAWLEQFASPPQHRLWAVGTDGASRYVVYGDATVENLKKMHSIYHAPCTWRAAS
jgi:uncharacterized LabA/DUF88 family protein